MLLTCERICDVRRAQEWTAALHAWCDAQPDLVAFTGPCLVHRSEILQLQGAWPDALEQAQRACEQLAKRSPSGAGRAFYQRAELHRLRGEPELAEHLYGEAARNGWEPQPGMALLRLAQGDVEASAATIRRVVEETGNRQGPTGGRSRAAVLGPCVEIMLAIDDCAGARVAADELAKLAAEMDAPWLRALAGQAMGAVLLAEGDAQAALAVLREAWAVMQQLDAPYESARVRVLIGLACLKLRDRDTAHLHLQAAGAVFERLGAGPDLARLQRLSSSKPSDTLGQLASASARYCCWWLLARPTARSPPRWPSASTRWPAT